MVTELRFLDGAACLVMMLYLFWVCAMMPGGLAMLGRKIVVNATALFLCMRVTLPFSPEAPDWLRLLSVVGMHVAMAGILIVWRREALAFARCKFTLNGRQERAADNLPSTSHGTTS